MQRLLSRLRAWGQAFWKRHIVDDEPDWDAAFDFEAYARQKQSTTLEEQYKWNKGDRR